MPRINYPSGSVAPLTFGGGTGTGATNWYTYTYPDVYAMAQKIEALEAKVKELESDRLAWEIVDALLNGRSPTRHKR